MTYVPAITPPMKVAELLAGEKKVARSDDRVIEVVVMWKGAIEKIEHLDIDPEKPVSFHIGEDPTCDFIVPIEQLGGKPKIQLVTINALSEVFIQIPSSARAELVAPNGRKLVLTDSPSQLHHGERIEIQIGNCIFTTKLITRGANRSVGMRFNKSLALFGTLSLVLHAVFFAVLFFTPPMPTGVSYDSFRAVHRFMSIEVEAPVGQGSPNGSDKAPLFPVPAGESAK